MAINLLYCQFPAYTYVGVFPNSYGFGHRLTTFSSTPVVIICRRQLMHILILVNHSTIEVLILKLMTRFSFLSSKKREDIAKRERYVHCLYLKCLPSEYLRYIDHCLLEALDVLLIDNPKVEEHGKRLVSLALDFQPKIFVRSLHGAESKALDGSLP